MTTIATKLKWELWMAEGFINVHCADDYSCEQDNPHPGVWTAYHHLEEIGTGSWQKCRSICQKHYEARQ